MDTLLQLRTGKLQGTTRLDLSCGLTEFPREVFDLADSLEILNLSGNALTSLPADLPRLRKLRILFCSDNRFTHLPEVVGDCQQLSMVGFKANQIRTVPPASLARSLRWLILTDNCIENLPDSLGQCAQMQKLMLAGNRLQQLPETLAQCQQLELLRIAANRLNALPEWLLALPRLSWLAYAGNPLCAAQEAASISTEPATRIDWKDLTIRNKLGEGASGIIYQAQWQCKPGVFQSVAVKLFKGSMTSDGTPQSEMAASLTAGFHPNQVGILGKLAHHPEGTSGLVMQLIDPSFQNLAGPPSLASCTRDIYAGSTRFTPRIALKIARDIASAAAHIHAKGILHGDLYAHNILWNGQGDCLLGDFGAASFLPGNHKQAQTLQRIEARAFGCLLDELLERCDEWGDARPTLEKMSLLQARCLQPDVASRPLLADIHLAVSDAYKELEGFC